jgi:septal ring factor EnvC (AmiA/AmiB activator)
MRRPQSFGQQAFGRQALIDPGTALIPAKAAIQNASLRFPTLAATSGRAMALALAFFVLGSLAAQAQDVRGLEVCTAEKQMDRRTGCLQANIDFLMSLIDKNARESRQKLDQAAKDLAAARNEIVAMKAALAANQARLDKLEKPEKPKEAK